MRNEGSEFQTDGAEHRKARFASLVLVNGSVSSKVMYIVLYRSAVNKSCSKPPAYEAIFFIEFQLKRITGMI